MALETEVKIRISQADLGPIRARLAALEARCVSSRQKEENFLFDFPDGNLEAVGCAIRLRIYGEKALLTFKGKVQDDPRYKKREEVETSVGDPLTTKKILEALGMNVSFQYSKFREIYRLSVNQQQVEVCLDETPVGTFVEIEGRAPAIEELAAHFGWAPDSFIRKNYVEMYLEELTADP